MAGVRREILHTLGLPVCIDEVPDTAAGGKLALRAGYTFNQLLAAAKYVAAESWIAALQDGSRKRYVAPKESEWKARLLAAWERGYSTMELMVLFDMGSPAAVTQALHRLGVKSLTRFPRWHDDEENVLIELVNQGSSVEEISKVLRRTPLAVAQRAATLGKKDFANQWLSIGRIKT